MRGCLWVSDFVLWLDRLETQVTMVSMDRAGSHTMPMLSSSAVKPNIAFHQLTLVLLTYYLHRSLEVRIINCTNTELQIFEDSPAPVTCGDITSADLDVVWRRSDGVSIGECSAAGTCRDDLYNDYRLSRSPMSTESQLTLVPDYRRHARLTVTCQEKARSSTDSCTLVIKRHSVLSECHVTTNPVDWTVSGSCRVQQAFSSDNIYTCTWTRNDGQTLGGFDASRELCSFTQALPQAGGLYTYSISVSPPATTAFSQQLTLDTVEPGDVTTTCPHSVVRGGDLSCTCQTTNTASPPATVRWEGRDSEKLVKTNVQREDNGTQFTCHVTWAGRVYTSINYTLLVASTENVSDVPGTTNVSSSAPAVIGPIIGVIVVMVVIAIIAIFLFIYIRQRKQKLNKIPQETAECQTENDDVIKEPPLYTHLTPPVDNQDYEDLHVRGRTEDATTRTLSAINVYQNTLRLAENTYDTTSTPSEEHHYTELQVKATPGVTPRDLSNREEEDGNVY
ncbi:uncharacterized protein LOC112568982 isoform X2 [Pomacea canaliculata]|uniref:uncharacterized protein LOC112568982 isoform X2 n=1 Tax=Pomacea canaliculata TaxID=400727 RepID=UPI000D728883|nr:uncharacterized protein LOC112568982 isoform X2 [Pomacea canaliculata]